MAQIEQRTFDLIRKESGIDVALGSNATSVFGRLDQPFGPRSGAIDDHIASIDRVGQARQPAAALDAESRQMIELVTSQLQLGNYDSLPSYGTDLPPDIYNDGTVSTTTKRRFAVEDTYHGKHLSAAESRDVSVTTQAGAAEPIETSDHGGVTVDLDPCPTASGVVAGKMTIVFSEASGAANATIATVVQATFSATVDGSATAGEYTTDAEARFVRFPSGSSYPTTEIVVQALSKVDSHSGKHTFEYPKLSAHDDGSMTGPALDEHRVILSQLATQVVERVAGSAIRGAEKWWRGPDHCVVVALSADPSTQVRQGGTATVHASVQTFPDPDLTSVEVRAPLMASATGAGSAQPVGQSVDYGTSFMVKLADIDGAQVTLTVQSISNRGIGTDSITIASVKKATPTPPPASCPPRGGSLWLGPPADGAQLAQSNVCRESDPPGVRTFEGTITGTLTLVYPETYDGSSTTTATVNVTLKTPYGPQSRIVQDSGTISVSGTTIPGDCEGSGAVSGSIRQEGPEPHSVFTSDGTQLGDLIVDDGPMGVPGGPDGHQTALFVRVQATYGVNGTCGLLSKRPEAATVSLYTRTCPGGPPTLTSFILKPTSPGTFKGTCHSEIVLESGLGATETMDWTGEIHEVGP